jgi:two-component system OmpR family response regulator
MRILLIEDDPILGEALHDFLRAEGHVVEWVQRLSQARAALTGQPFDMLVIDWQLPDGSGQAWLAGLRDAQVSTPAILATARDQLADRVTGLNAGADDYLVKPFAPEELAARVLAVARRTVGLPVNTMVCGPVRLDLKAKSAWLDEQPVALTSREWALLEALALRKGRTVSKSDLENLVVGFDGAMSSNALEVHMSSIRKKLGKDVVQTHRGLGYRWGG